MCTCRNGELKLVEVFSIISHNCPVLCEGERLRTKQLCKVKGVVHSDAL